MKTVACLTTIPSRIGLLDTTLNSLILQEEAFDRIYICIPHWSVRFNCSYEIPESLAKRTDITILRCTDFGPATKILGLLEANLPEIKPDTKIFFCDDDRVYPPTYSGQMMKALDEHPDSIICLATTPYWKFFTNGDPSYDITSSRDHPVGKYGVRSGWVDIFEGFGGVIVQPRFFEILRAIDIPVEFRVVDDIWLSGHVRSNGWTIWGVCLPSPSTHEGDAQDPLSRLNGDNERFLCNQRCIAYYQAKYSVWNDPPPPVQKSYLERMTEQFRQLPRRPRNRIPRSKPTVFNPNGKQE
jgi:hypothetical protein